MTSVTVENVVTALKSSDSSNTSDKAVTVRGRTDSGDRVVTALTVETAITV